MKLPNIVMKANVLVACLISMAVVTPSFAGYDNSCVGTYYLHEASGNTSLWTFEKDGTMLSVSSAQQQFNFTNAQGNWNSAYDSSAIVKMFDYTLGNPASASSIVRVDAKWKFSKDCKTAKVDFTGTPCTQANPLCIATPFVNEHNDSATRVAS